MLKQTVALMALCVLFSLPGNAEDATERLYEMEEVVVTSHPIIEGNTVTRYAESVSTVGVHQIDDLNAQDMPSALRRVPGVTISRYNVIGNYGGGDGGAVFIRGHGSGRPGAEISTMVDGVRRFSGIWTHPLMDLMSIDFAESIEIQKSARPVTNGNMAFSAVNVIPRRMHSEGFTTRVHSIAGSYGTLVEKLEHGGMIGGFDYFLTGSHRQSDGHRDNADGETQSLYGRAGYRFNSHWDLSMQFNHSDGWAHDPLQEGASPKPNTERYETDTDLYIAKLEHSHGPFEGTIKAYYDDGYMDWREWDDANAVDSHGITTYDNYGVNIKEHIRLIEGNEIIAGFDADSYGGSFISKSSAGDGPKTADIFVNTAPYVMISHTFGKEIQIIPSAGVRYNHSSEFGGDLGWQGGLVVARQASSAHLNYARSFNLPGVYAKVMYSDFWSFANNPDGWKDLGAEYLDHYEIGVSHRLNEKMSFDLTWFHDSVSDALRVVPPPPPPPSIQNIGSYTSSGIEATADFSPIQKMDIFIGATYMNVTPKEVPNAPEFTLTSGIGYTAFNRLRLSLDVEYLDDRYIQGTRSPDEMKQVDAYTLANCRVGWLVPVGMTIGEIFLSVENIGDTDYEYRPGYPMPGRNFMAGIDVRI